MEQEAIVEELSNRFDFDIGKADHIRFEADLGWGSGVIISDVTVSK